MNRADDPVFVNTVSTSFAIPLQLLNWACEGSPLMDRENLTFDDVAAYLAAHPMVTGNWFGPTGRAERATWIARD